MAVGGDPGPRTGGRTTLAGLLRVARERALLTQEELAERAGLSVRAIRDLEAGRVAQPRSASVRLLADALALTGAARAALIDAVGSQPEPTAPAPPVVPAQLPADVGDFAGRDGHLTQLDELLPGEAGAQPGAVVIAGIAGTGGVGKTALAVHWAHRVADRFPDGQLYVNLHGSTVGLSPLPPLEVLGRFLRALGMQPSAIPAELEEAAGAFRSQVADRRLLVVLDNARDAAQVRPLLPASPGCAVLVTSRRVLTALEGARHLRLDVLSEQEAIRLLGRVAGAKRVAAEPEAAAQVARCCGYLPLALRIAGARLAARPSWPVAALADRLADAQGRLDELELADVGVRASFAVSWQELRASRDPGDRAAAAALPLLGLLDGVDLGVPVAARLLDRADDLTERLLERLVDAQLLEGPKPGRYGMHDLVRLYARELAGNQDTEPDRAAARTRALSLYVATAWHTLALLQPGDARLRRVDDRWRKGGLELADEQAALAWLETERPNLLAAIHQGATAPGVPSEIAVQLAHALSGFLLLRCYWQDLTQVNRAALRIARRLGDRAAQAQANNDLGGAAYSQGRYAEALACCQQSLTIRQDLGDRHGQATSLSNLGLIHARQGRMDQALACFQESLTINRDLGDRRGQALSLNNLGRAYLKHRRFADALACFQESLTINRDVGYRRGQATSLDNLGILHRQQGRLDQALACQQEGLAINRELGDRFGQAECLCAVGVIYQRQGRYHQALACQRDSLALYRELGDRHGEAENLRELGVTLQALGRREEARAHWRQALTILEQLQTTDADEVRDLLATLTSEPAQCQG